MQPRFRPARTQSLPPMAVVEGACGVLRRLPAAAWAWLFVGSVPFVLLFLWFWTDMSRAPGAPGRLVGSALAVALAYGWMKTAHAWFGAHLLEVLRGGSGCEPLPWHGWARLLASQILVFAFMPFALFLAALVVVPFGWVVAFQHNVSLLAVGHFRKGGGAAGLIRAAMDAARRDALQNHAVLTILGVCGFLLFLNLLILSFTLPQLAESFTGISNPVSASPMALLNTTMLAILVVLAWLGMTPFYRAAYAVRCFHAISRHNGEDLRAALRIARRKSAGAAALAVGLGFIGLFAALPAVADEPISLPQATPTAPPTVSPVELDRNLRDVLEAPHFQWRLPREVVADAEMGWIESMARDFQQWVNRQIRAFTNMLERWIDALIRRMMRGDGKSAPDNWLSGLVGGSALARVLLIVAAAAVVGGVAYWLVRMWRTRGKQPKPKATVAAPEVDLEAETVLATDQSEDEWLSLARERLAAGDTRQAVRALFLGTLAALGGAGRVAIARGKTNGMYARELARRTPGMAELHAAFQENRRLFDHAWYGGHDVPSTAWETFQQNHHTITRHATS